jgi:hypothetical protein
MPEMNKEQTKATFEGWAIVELFGHNQRQSWLYQILWRLCNLCDHPDDPRNCQDCGGTIGYTAGINLDSSREGKQKAIAATHRR